MSNHTMTLYKTQHFPCQTKRRQKNTHKVLLGIGGNVGDTKRRFTHLLYVLKRAAFVHIIETAPILKNPPFGYTAQDDFYNSLLLVETKLTPATLLAYVLRVEKRFGRKRLLKDGPRTLDIDLIFYEKVTMNSKKLTLPHPGWSQRASVLIPLYYMKGNV